MTHRWRVLAIAGAALLLAAGAAFLLDRLLPPRLERLEDRSVLVLAEDGAILRAFTTQDGLWRLPVAPAAVDAKFLNYLLAIEDKRFRAHPGIDPAAILRAIAQAARAGRVVSGASTLSMQAARLLEQRSRSLSAKLIEMARAVQLEARLGKEGILGIYLALAPYGGNLEGVRAASLAYFGKEPTRLTEAEAALLVALPQSPERLRPDRYPQAARAARDRVLRRLLTLGLIDAPAYHSALVEAVPSARRAAPSDAPHLAERLRAEYPRAAVIRSGIRRDLQLRVQEIAARHRRDLEPTATIAILAIENASRSVRAYLGSADYFDHGQFGPIDMVRAVRSPGSALKPFIYGMAFEDLLVHPETVMVDRPLRFGDYAPENFDHLYRGEVPARRALQLSLNLPAVALLARIGPSRFAERLEHAGFGLTLPREAGNPGLPIALGGAGISLEELTALYAALADGGESRPLAFLAEPPLPPEHGRRLLSPLAVYYLTDILEGVPPPAAWLAAGKRDPVAIAFKTGTSYGFRDAWAVGYDRDYTIGVWVGRPDGSYSPGRMGRDAAAPILFEVFSQLPAGASAKAPIAPAGFLAGSNEDLPANLRRFAAEPLAAGAAPERDDLAIAFPLDGATLPLAPAEPLALKARGGALPLRWLVNGEAVDSMPYLRQAEWRPDGAGAQRVTVIDARGRSASAEIWLKIR